MPVIEIDPGYHYVIHTKNGEDHTILFKKTEKPPNVGDDVIFVHDGILEEDLVCVLKCRARHMNSEWPVQPSCISYEHRLNQAHADLQERKNERLEKGLSGKFGA